MCCENVEKNERINCLKSSRRAFHISGENEEEGAHV